MLGKLEGRGHRKILEGRLGRSIGRLFGEAERSPGGKAYDPAPRAAARDVTAGELGDKQCRGPRIDSEVTYRVGG